MNAIRPGLPPLPEKMRALPVDARGYPVPYFVAWIDGKPDHRVADTRKMPKAITRGLCWLCGCELGNVLRSFAIGPMCSITRCISEPPSHLECLEYAVKACPWITRPHAKRREAGLPEDRVLPAGNAIMRNPGAICLWTTDRFEVEAFGRQFLFFLGDPIHTEWYAEGRRATRAEVDESIRTGLPTLVAEAEKQEASVPGSGAMSDLEQRIARETKWLDAQLWPDADPT